MYNWNEIDLLWHFEAKKKNRKYKSILIVFPIACFEKIFFFFLLKAPLDPSPSGYKSF